MTMRKLKWIAILAPIVFIAILEYSRYALAPVLTSWRGHLLMNGVFLMGALFFYGGVFSLVGQMQQRLERQNRELVALRNAGLDIASDLALENVLHKVVHSARNLIGTRYGALSVIDEDGKIEAFLTSGIDESVRERLGGPPTGRGLLGVVLREGQRLRLEDLQKDTRSLGFPEGHPAMHSLLAVPVVCRSPFRGNLYLSEKLDNRPFSEQDEETLARFATNVAIAVDNAELHRQLRGAAVTEERLRLAHEMHDGQAQVLAYVNTKAQAVKEFLRRGQLEEAEVQLDQLASASREVYADVREGILGLRAASDPNKDFVSSLRQHIEQWQGQSGITADLEICGEPRIAIDFELQLMRIVQEALANVRKHSGSSRVRLEVKTEAQEVMVTISDDGVGFEPSAIDRQRRPRFGLATMRERAQAIGAALRIESEPGRGTRVEIRCPLVTARG